MLTLRQVDNVVQSSLFIVKGWEHERQEQGATILYTVWSNETSPKLNLGVYRVWEWIDGSGRCSWQPLTETSPEQEKLRRMFHMDMVMSVLVEANSRIAQSTPITITEAIKRYIKALQTGETPENSDSPIYKFLQSIYKLGNGDLQKGVELHRKRTSLSDIELAIIEYWILPNQNNMLEKLIMDMPEEEALKLLPEYIKDKRKSVLQANTSTVSDESESPKGKARTAQDDTWRPLRPDGYEVHADNTQGTAIYKRDDNGKIIEVYPSPNPGWEARITADSLSFEKVTEGAAYDPRPVDSEEIESPIRLNHTSGIFQPGLYPAQDKDRIIKVVSDTLAGLMSNATIEPAKTEIESPKDDKPKQKGRYRLTQDDIRYRKKKVKEAEKMKKDNPLKQWKEIDSDFANELGISERTFRDWRHTHYS